MFRRAEFRLAAFLALLVAATGLLFSPAQAQFRGGYAFLQAVESRDGTKATEALKDDPSFINTRNPDTGQTALIIVTKRRDISWLRFLLAKDADPSIGDRQGVTPLMHAALILAVQSKNVAMVRLLVKRGANPDKADHVAGMSARAYAKRDDRTGQIVALLDAKPDGPVRDLGPTFGPN